VKDRRLPLLFVNRWPSICGAILLLAGAGRAGGPLRVDAIGGTASGQNPVIFDADGAITGKGGILGFAGFGDSQDIDGVTYVTEGKAVLNGAADASLRRSGRLLG
jgi:hypothetical protein